MQTNDFQFFDKFGEIYNNKNIMHNVMFSEEKYMEFKNRLGYF